MSIEPPMPNEIVIGDDLILRRSFDTPPKVLHGLIQQNLEHLGPWMPWAVPQNNTRAVTEFLESRRIQWNESGEQGYSIYFAEELAGNIGIGDFNSPVQAVSIGYWISKHLEGRGIMTRSVEALMRLAFEDHSMNQVIIRAAPRNVRSRAIPERLGFTETGVERQMSRNAAGKFLDLVIYSLLRSEWET